MGTFLVAMLANPEVFRRAQKEVDAATGGERLPTFADKGTLPYVEALFLEVLRTNTVTPLGELRVH
jgi:cytochrome P450